MHVANQQGFSATLVLRPRCVAQSEGLLFFDETGLGLADMTGPLAHISPGQGALLRVCRACSILPRVLVCASVWPQPSDQACPDG